jgi:phosphoribosylaminoimidazole-succinocarboxamide synthase
MNVRVVKKSDLQFVLPEVNLQGLGERYSGKVRDCFEVDGKRILVATDRLSCFDKIVASVPFKGQVLTGISAFWFERIHKDLPTHYISRPDPSVMVVKRCEVIPIEVVVRGYLAGSAWRSYQKGEAVPGLALSAQLKEFDALPRPVITPSTKAPAGSHDMPISADEAIASGAVSLEEWKQIEELALDLFSRGQRFALEHGLILADTKYEFGRHDGKVTIIDEVHTLDSTRYWDRGSYERCMREGGTPIMLDKEPVRRWLMARGYSGEGTPPEIPEEEVLSIAERYVEAYRRVTGTHFVPTRVDPVKRIVSSLTAAGFPCS